MEVDDFLCVRQCSYYYNKFIVAHCGLYFTDRETEAPRVTSKLQLIHIKLGFKSGSV